jgi:two-component system, sensor histidine kinase RegB
MVRIPFMDDMTRTTPAQTPVITGQWLVRFRWAVTAGAVIAIGVTRMTLGLRFPVAVVALALAVQLTSNVWLARQTGGGAGSEERTLGAVLLLDIALLTVLVLATGGPSNPFTISYLVYITLAAVTLRSTWTWTMTAACIGGYGLLFVTPLRTLFDPRAVHAAMQPQLGHQVGMWVAFLAAAALTATFVTRIRVALEARERALGEARRVAARQDRLASLTTLAAGAAHELATPLATIATAAVELERALAAGNAAAGEPLADARLVRSQVERCREILDQMSGRADPSIAQQPQSLQASLIVARALSGISGAEQQQVHVRVQPDLPPVLLPLEAAARVVRSLIKNALHASTTGQEVLVTVAQRHHAIRFEVRDEGAGMSPEVAARAGEPFYTTRPAGAGFGLGLFLVRTFADQWGGEMQLSSTAGAGTTVSLDVPADHP